MKSSVATSSVAGFIAANESVRARMLSPVSTMSSTTITWRASMFSRSPKTSVTLPVEVVP